MSNRGFKKKIRERVTYPLLADEPGNNLSVDIHGGSQVALANVV